MWQVDHRPVDHGAHQPEGEARGGDPLPGEEPPRDEAGGAPGPSRQRDGDDLPGCPLLSQPGHAHQSPDEAADQSRWNPERRRTPRTRRPRPEADPRVLPARAFGRPAPARPHRYGSHPRPEAHHRR
ncbi:Uncharacterised protein [Chlamydia trachomatis]|nr:Uncharacterised protein [Chlamydia trachomatis]